MSDTLETENLSSTFPKARLDAMAKFHREFDPRNPEKWRADAAWDFTAHFDSAPEAIYLANQLNNIRQGLYEIRYPELKSRRLIPHNTSMPRGMQEYTVRAIDAAGQPIISRDQPDDIPTVELKTSQGTMSMFNLMLGYGYSDQDAEAALYAGMPLQLAKAKGVRDIMARTLDDIAFKGTTAVSGVIGLLNATGTTTYAPPADGTGASKLWKDKTSDQVIRDLNAMGDAIITGTADVEEPDTWLLPLSLHRAITTRRVGDGTSATILKYFVENRDTPVSIERTQKSETAGASSATRCVVYKNDPSKLEMIVPVEFFQKQPEVRGFRVTTNCLMRTGGLALYIPKSVCYADGQ